MDFFRNPDMSMFFFILCILEGIAIKFLLGTNTEAERAGVAIGRAKGAKAVKIILSYLIRKGELRSGYTDLFKEPHTEGVEILKELDSTLYKGD
jgi:hypothetical protein